MLSKVTSKRVKRTSQPSTKAGSLSDAGGKAYPLMASASPEAVNRTPPGPGSVGAVNGCSAELVPPGGGADAQAALLAQVTFVEPLEHDAAPATAMAINPSPLHPCRSCLRMVVLPGVRSFVRQSAPVHENA
jgi:hypothetical protein